MTDQRLSKILAAAGIASRREAEKIIFEGRVKVNGAIVTTPQTRVNGQKDHIAVDGQKISFTNDKVYFLLNKPSGFLCFTDRKAKERLVLDLFAPIPGRSFILGKLDKDSTGLLLVTNDGVFAQNALHPSKKLSNEYLVKVEEEITLEHLYSLSKGVFIKDGVFIKPLSVKKVRKGTLKLVISSEKTHQIREMLASCNLNLLEITRIRLGPLLLGKLPMGAYRPLTENEKNLFLS